MLDVACVEVTTETVVNYFEKAGISKEKHPEALLDTKDPFKDLQEQFDKIVVYNTKFFPEGTTANDKVSVDDSLTSTEPLMIDDAILCDAFDEQGSETVDGTDDVSNKSNCLQPGYVREALDILWEYMLFSENAEFTHKYLNEMSVLVVENELWAKLRQADIQNFFQ